jgi:hypothetical protein
MRLICPACTAFLCAFDLLELDGRDLRREPIEDRKAALAKLAHNAKPGIQLSVHLDHPGDIVFEHACDAPRPRLRPDFTDQLTVCVKQTARAFDAARALRISFAGARIS